MIDFVEGFGEIDNVNLTSMHFQVRRGSRYRYTTSAKLWTSFEENRIEAHKFVDERDQ